MKIINLTPHPLVLRRKCSNCAGTGDDGQDGHTAGHHPCPAPGCYDGAIEETIPSSGVARCATVETECGALYGMPVVVTKYGAIEGLPDPKFPCGHNVVPLKSSRWPGATGHELGYKCTQCGAVTETIYVVSSITAQECPGRADVFVPARPVRDEQGRVVACEALGMIL